MQQPELATEMIAKLAGLLRNTTTFPEAHAVTLREELATIEEYLSIEQIRFGPCLVVLLEILQKPTKRRSLDLRFDMASHVVPWGARSQSEPR